jgi:hydrogenase maturation protein HypF
MAALATAPSLTPATTDRAHARVWRVVGRVQGVGFRPFVYRLAHHHGLCGWVRNEGGDVLVHAQGAPAALHAFGSALAGSAPPAALVHSLSTRQVPAQSIRGFQIRPSTYGADSSARIPTDLFACDECLEEMGDPAARRYRYPFINCTQCGPRYTVIRSLPYDRANTTMDGFALCIDCAREFADPLDRRFHAQPLACARCGPELRWQQDGLVLRGNEAAMAAAVTALRAGRIIALRGVGGYHLMCDATQPAAVDRLRLRKHRPAKPLAVLVPWRGSDGLDYARTLAHLHPDQVAALTDAARPLVLAQRRATALVGSAIAPGLDEIALMLPYSPLLHLLLEDFGAAVVATSGNRSGESVMIDPAQVEERLGGVADGFLHHDRDIARPADDPVLRRIAGAVRPLRLGRGTAPLELRLPVAIGIPTLAVGAFGKNTVALAWGDRAVVSPHIGDLGSLRSQTVFAQVATQLQELHGVTAQQVVHDAHPGFPNTRWARALGMPSRAVWHHMAHASALAGEFAVDTPLLCFTWDGVGLGPDRTLWGGEALLGLPGHWQRVASFRPFCLPGGDRVAGQPWRAALALSWECALAWDGAGAGAIAALDLAGLRYASVAGLNAPLTSAAGRLFDAAAALLGICTHASYEGEAPMRLEARAAFAGLPPKAPALPLERDAQGVWRADWRPLVGQLLDPGQTTSVRAALFHARLASTVCEQALRVRERARVDRIGLCGGVFQNALLARRATELLTQAGFEVLMPRILPVNDAAISYGQLVEAAALGSTGLGPSRAGRAVAGAGRG